MGKTNRQTQRGKRVGKLIVDKNGQREGVSVKADAHTYTSYTCRHLILRSEHQQLTAAFISHRAVQSDVTDTCRTMAPALRQS